MQGSLAQKKLLITSKNYNQAIQIKDASVIINSEAQMSQITENEEQLFILYQVEDDMDMTKNYYYILNLRSELLLTVRGNKILQTGYSNSNEQKFQFIELPNGCYIIQQKESDKVLEVIQSQQSDGMNLTVNHFSYGYGNQLFTLKESFRMFDMNQDRFLVNDICQQSKYQLVPNIPINIKCAHSNLYFDVFEHSKIKNGPIVQWSQNNKNNQKFILERIEIELPLEQMIQSNAQKKQPNHNSSKNNNTLLQTKSSLILNEPNYLEAVFYVRCVESNLYLTIQNERLSDGGKLVQDELQPFSKNHHQRFLFQILINGNFHIKPYHSKKYLDIEGESYKCGANVIQFHKNCQFNQQFNVIYL